MVSTLRTSRSSLAVAVYLTCHSLLRFIIQARFARDCLHRMNDLVKKLEVTLGPDTAELSMRFGLHSGPVTAGVLRGDKSRFQLFGDTVVGP